MTSSRVLAYGLSVSGLVAGSSPSGEPGRPWPTLSLGFVQGDSPRDTTAVVGESAARLDIGGVAGIVVSRDPLRLDVHAPQQLSPNALLHPVLAFGGSVVARWLGRTALHAGAVVVNRRAWVLLGGPKSGKSTLIAQLHLLGVTAVSDDVTVVEDGMVLAGPGIGDLREPAARQLGLGVAVDEAIGRPRWRYHFEHQPIETPLAGFVLLAWGTRTALTRMPVSQRIAVLNRHEALGLPPTGHRGHLDLLRLPVFRFERPQAWTEVEASATSLLSLLG